MENIRFYLYENSQCLVVKFSVYSNRHVFVMKNWNSMHFWGFKLNPKKELLQLFVNIPNPDVTILYTYVTIKTRYEHISFPLDYLLHKHTHYFYTPVTVKAWASLLSVQRLIRLVSTFVMNLGCKFKINNTRWFIGLSRICKAVEVCDRSIPLLVKENLPATQTWRRNLPPQHIII